MRGVGFDVAFGFVDAGGANAPTKVARTRS